MNKPKNKAGTKGRAFTGTPANKSRRVPAQPRQKIRQLLSSFISVDLPGTAAKKQ